jgi:hypothetical protein
MGEVAAKRPRFRNLDRLIAALTLVIGFVVAVTVGFLHEWIWAGGITIGAALAWLNFRWLKQGVSALAAASVAQATQQSARVPFGSYFFAMFRYALIALSMYVIFKYLKVPILSMIVGLFALGAATVVACLYEIMRPVD